MNELENFFYDLINWRYLRHLKEALLPFEDQGYKTKIEVKVNNTTTLSVYTIVKEGEEERWGCGQYYELMYSRNISPNIGSDDLVYNTIIDIGTEDRDFLINNLRNPNNILNMLNSSHEKLIFSSRP